MDPVKKLGMLVFNEMLYLLTQESGLMSDFECEEIIIKAISQILLREPDLADQIAAKFSEPELDIDDFIWLIIRSQLEQS